MFSAQNVGSLAVQGSWDTFSAVNVSLYAEALKTCHFTLCIAIFFSAESINFFTRELKIPVTKNHFKAP
jgi:hypothetical protein